MAWTLTQAHEELRTQAAQAAANARTVALADAGAGPSTLQIYDAADAATRVLLATITLAKPCGVLVDGKIQLVQADPMGDMVTASGEPTYAEWLDGNGDVIGSCTVSDAAGSGDLKISTRPDGLIFEGGFVQITGGLIG